MCIVCEPLTDQELYDWVALCERISVAITPNREQQWHAINYIAGAMRYHPAGVRAVLKCVARDNDRAAEELVYKPLASDE